MNFTKLKYLLIFVFLIQGFVKLQAQKINFFQPDSQLNKKRILAVSLTVPSLYVGIYGGLGLYWYKDQFTDQFQWFNDFHEWQQMDKVGHAVTAFQATRTFDGLLKWAGVPKKKRLIFASFTGIVMQSPLELFDGFAKDYGASWPDLVANTTGNALAFANIAIWDEHRITYKFSFHRTKYADQAPHVLGTGLGSTIKDYNGQTYWISANIHDFLKKKHPNSKFPKWINIAVGYGAEGMIGGYGKEDWSIIKNREYRQIFIAPDIALSKIPVKNHFLKMVLSALDFIHLPLPALRYDRTGFRFYPAYF